MAERAFRNNLGGYQSKSSKYKFKIEEPDEERLSTKDNDYDQAHIINELKQDLDEKKVEIKQLSDELRRLKNRESSLDAENKIMKSQLM